MSKIVDKTGILKKLCIIAVLAFFLLNAGPIYSNCDQCTDLCRLVDEYLQTEKNIEFYKLYARSTDEKIRKKPAAGKSVVDEAYEDFEKWDKTRELPCAQPPPPPQPPGQQPKPSAVTRASVDGSNDSCAIIANGENLDDPKARQGWEDQWNCKPMTDAIFAHESVHRLHCMERYSEDPKGAAEWLGRSENMAQSELEAHLAHKKVIEDAIRNIIRQKGCGWQPTKRQKIDPNSVPSLKQTQKMQRGWKAAKTLERIRAIRNSS